MSNRETAWFLTGSEENLEISIERAAETGARYVVTGLAASFDDATVESRVEITGAAGATIIELNFVGQIVVTGLEIVLDRGVEVGVFLPAGGVGVRGSVLLNGYVK